MKKGLIIGAVAAGIALLLLALVVIMVRRPAMYWIARSLTVEGMKLSSLHRNDKAMQAFNAAIAVDGQYAQAFAQRGYLEVDLGKYQDAFRDGDRAVALDKNLAVGWGVRGYAREWLGQGKPAGDDFEQAIRLAPNVAVYHAHLSFIAKRMDDLPKAKAEIERAIELDPRAPLAYDDKASLDLVLDDVTGADRDETHAIDLSPAWATAYGHRAWVRICEGKYDEAISDTNDASRLKPDYEYAIYLRSVAERRKGDPQSAAQTITGLLTIAPDYHAAHFERAIAYYDAGNLAAARTDLEVNESQPEVAARRQLWLWIVDTESGHGPDANTALAAWLTDKPPATLDQKIAALILGRTTPEALAQEASSNESAAKQRATICQVWYYAGKVALLKNDRVQARADFEKAIESRATDKAEFGESLREFSKL
jgi:tetratricopeptide (TPR) repeat protein